MPEKSLSSKYFGIIASHNCFTWLHSQTAKTAFIVFRLLALRRKQFITYENDYIQWLLLLFLLIFSVSLSGSDDFVLFDLLDGNGALFANVLCDIAILHTSSIRHFEWKHSLWFHPVGQYQTCFIFWAIFRTHHLSHVLTRHMFLCTFFCFWRNWKSGSKKLPSGTECTLKSSCLSKLDQ